MEIIKLYDLVKKLLQEKEELRGDDDFLYCEVIKNIYPNILNLTAEQFFYKRKNYKIPSFESVSRCRRKLQEEHPELRPPKKVQEARQIQEEKFYNFAKLKQQAFEF